VPQISFSNLGTSKVACHANTFHPNHYPTCLATYFLDRARHTWKFGRRIPLPLQVNERNFATPNGRFTFDGPVTGTDFAGFLLGGRPSTTTLLQLRPPNSSFPCSRTRYGGAFAQILLEGEINLTRLNLGVRWEVSMPWYTRKEIQTFVLEQSTVFFRSLPTAWYSRVILASQDSGSPRIRPRRPTLGPRVFTGIFGPESWGQSVFGGPLAKTSGRAVTVLLHFGRGSEPF